MTVLSGEKDTPEGPSNEAADPCGSQDSSDRDEMLRMMKESKRTYNEMSLHEKELVKQQKEKDNIIMLLNSVEAMIGP